MKALAGMRDAAAEHDPLDVVGERQQVDAPGDGAAGGLDDLGRDRVTGGRRRRRRPRHRRGLRSIGPGRARSVAPPSPLSSGRRSPGRRRPPRSSPWLPQAQRGPSRSMIACPISPARPSAPRWSWPSRTTPGRDAGADREQRERLRRPEQAAPVEAQRRRSDVVFDDGGDAEARLQPGAERQVVPVEVHGEGQWPRSRSTRPGHADAQRRDVRRATPASRKCGVDERRDRVRGAIRSPTAVGATARATDRAIRSQTRIAVFVPPMSTPTTRSPTAHRPSPSDAIRSRAASCRAADSQPSSAVSRSAEAPITTRSPIGGAISMRTSRASRRATGAAPRPRPRRATASPRLGDAAVEDDPLDVEHTDQRSDAWPRYRPAAPRRGARPRRRRRDRL